MKRRSDEELVREYICEIVNSQLNEDMGGGMGDFYDTSMYSGGLYGGGGGGSMGGLYKAFVKPFTDVIGVAVGKTKEVARRVVTLAHVAFETVMTTFIPFLTDSYDEIFAKEAADIKGIRSEYAKYTQATDEALRGPGATLLAFMAFPQAALLHRSVEDGPQAIKNVLSVATGGVTDKYLGGSSSGGGGGGPRSSGMFDSHVRNKSLKLFLEDEKSSKDKKKSKEKDDADIKLADKIRDKKFVSAVIKKSDMMRSASEEAKRIYRQTLKSAFEQAQGVLSAKSLDEIEKITGEKIKGREEIKRKIADSLKSSSGEEKQSAANQNKKTEEALLKSVRESAKKLYISKLEKQVKPVRDKYGDDFPFVVDYDTVIQKIKSL